MKEFIIEENEAGQRFDKYLAKLLREAPKSFFYKMLRKKNIIFSGEYLMERKPQETKNFSKATPSNCF